MAVMRECFSWTAFAYSANAWVAPCWFMPFHLLPTSSQLSSPQSPAPLERANTLTISTHSGSCAHLTSLIRRALPLTCHKLTYTRAQPRINLACISKVTRHLPEHLLVASVKHMWPGSLISKERFVLVIGFHASLSLSIKTACIARSCHLSSILFIARNNIPIIASSPIMMTVRH